MKNSKNRVLSLLLAIFMLLSNVAPAMAANDNSNGNANAFDYSSVVEQLKAKRAGNGEQLPEVYEDDQKVRVVVELQRDPLIDFAEAKGLAVKDLPTVQANSYEQTLLSEQASVKQKILSADIELFETGDDSTHSNYSYTTVINGFSTFVKAEDLGKLEDLREVKHVYVVNEYNRPADIPQMITSNDMVVSNSAWNLGFKGEGMVVSVLDSGYDIAHKDFKLTDDSKVRLNQSLSESIIKQQNLPGRYYSAKFPYAYNYYDHTHKIKSEASNHGQHVAGTIAANGEVMGVAPEAQLLGMKVFSDDPLYSTTFSDVYVKAIDDSIKLGADAINMSLGSPAGSYIYGSLEDKAIARAREAGILVLIAAGNEHSIANGLDAVRAQLVNQNSLLPYARNVDTAVVGSPSLYGEGISVASVNNTHIQGRAIKYTAAGKDYTTNLSVASGSPAPWENLPGEYTGSDIVVIDKNNKGDASKAPGDAASFVGKDVKGKIVLVERGNNFIDSIANAQNNGAKAMIVYNNERPGGDDSLINMAGGDTAKIPMMMIRRVDGLRIIENLDNVKVSFPAGVVSFEHTKPRLVSDFSSVGPTPELGIKPELSAPGGDIYSTDNDDSYVTMSGTSMATPHVAGGTALVYQRILKDQSIFGNLSKQEVGKLSKILLLNTAVPFKNENDNYYLVRQQGSGLMNLTGATTTDTYVVNKATGGAKVELGSFTDNKIVMNFTIYNKSKSMRVFDVHANALTDETTNDNGYNYVTEKSKPLNNITVTGGGEVIVPAHGKKDVRVTIDLSKAIGSELKENNFVEGFVFFDSKQDLTNLSVPYLGFYGNYEELKVLDEPVYNLYDDDKSNDPFFRSTGLVYQVNGNPKFAVLAHQPAYFNPTATGQSNSGLGLRSVSLRNFDRIEYSIEDRDGNTLLNLGQAGAGKKITKLGQNPNPYSIFVEGLWDGKLAGQALEEGKSVYYTAKAYFLENSKPQTMRFEVRADHSMPEVEDENGTWVNTKNDKKPAKPTKVANTDLDIKYDAQSKTIKFKAKDDRKGSGIYSVMVANTLTLKAPKPEVMIWTGDKLNDILVSGDNFEGEYEIVVPDGFFTSKDIVVQIADKAENSLMGGVVIPLTSSNTDNNNNQPQPTDKLENPVLYNLNDNNRMLRFKLNKGDSNIVGIYFGRLDENGDLIEDEVKMEFDFLNKGYVDADLGDLKYKAGDQIVYMAVGLDASYNISNMSEELLATVVAAADDKVKPLQPNLDPFSLPTQKVTGRAHEKDLTITAKVGNEVVGEVKSGEDGKFELNLNRQVTNREQIVITAKRESSGLESDPIKQGVEKLKAPVLDKGYVLATDYNFTGDAFAPNVTVKLEYVPKTGYYAGKRQLIRSAVSNAQGKFAINYAFLNTRGITDGDIVYLYSERAGEKSDETEYVVGDLPGAEEPSGDLTMYINSPGLTTAYKDALVPFNITAFGWDNLDKATFGEHNLNISAGQQEVINPQNKQPVFKGKAFTITARLSLEEGYYDQPIMVYDSKSGKEYGITRRFWVDRTAPTVTSIVHNDISESRDLAPNHKEITITTPNDEARVEFVIKDNGAFINFFRGDTRLANYDKTNAGFEASDAEVRVNEIVRLNGQDKVEYKYSARDLARNEYNVTVKVVKEEAARNEGSATINASDRTVFVGDTVNTLHGVTAISATGEDITDRIEVSNKTIDTSKAGTHEITYSVTDGRTVTKKVVFSVVARKEDTLDRSHLVEAIEKARAYEADNYTLASFQNLVAGIDQAELLLKSVSATQADIDNMVVKLEELITQLIDISKIKSTYELAQSLVLAGKDEYTNASYDKLVKVTENARKVIADPNATKGKIDVAHAMMILAIEGLEKSADKNELISLYNSIVDQKAQGNISDEKHTKASLSKLNEALVNAEEVINNNESTQAEVKAAYDDLLTAYNGLVEKASLPVVNKDQLRLVYNEANKTDFNQYTPQSVAKLGVALNQAYEVLENEDATQDEVNLALNNLELALKALVKRADKTALLAAIESYSDVEQAKYTSESYGNFLEKLNAAKAVADNPNASQEEVDQALEELNKSHKELEETKSNRDKLAEAVEKAEALLAEQITESAKAELEAEIKKAKDILSIEDSADDDIAEATNRLNELMEKINKEDRDLRKILRELYEESLKYNNNKFSVQIKTMLLNGQKNAKAALDNPNASYKDLQRQIDMMIKILARVKNN